MIHETAILRLTFDSKEWALLVRQIKLARKQGVDPNEIYHSMDRFPGGIRKRLHEFFTKEGLVIDEPLFKRHLNPLDVILSEDMSKHDAYYEEVFVDRNKGPSKGKMTETSPQAPLKNYEADNIKQAFVKQFNGSGLGMFEQMFMSESMPTQAREREEEIEPEIESATKNKLPEPFIENASMSKCIHEINEILGLTP